MASMSESAHLLDLITGYWVAQAIHAAARLGIADLLGDGPRAVSELARATGSDEEALYRLLRGLAGRGLFREGPGNTFGLTPLAELLREDHPLSLRPLSVMFGDLQYHPWGDLLYSIETGRCAYERRAGEPFFDSLAKDPAAARTFSRAMTSFLQSIPALVVEVYDFSSYERIVDVGSAHGTLMTAVLKANPSPRGVLFDLPHVVDGARQPLAAAGLADRCDFVGGDFLSAVPPGGDLYILSTILHDWNDEQSVRILQRCREAMTPRGKLILVEMVIGEGNEPFFGKWLDLHMLVMHGGRDRTAVQYERLLRAGGFRLERIVPTGFLRSVLEAAPI
jgi:hypothetical protein